jgi:Flp pilus assembly protein TadG
VDDRGDERGLATLEVALITPVLLLVVLGLVQFALWYHAEQVVTAAAQEAAAQASLISGSPATAQQRAQVLLDGLSSIARGTQVSVGPPDTGSISVSVTARLNGILPGVVSLPLHATATAHLEKAP